MGDRSPDRMKALGRAALALLIEAVKELIPAFGPIQAAWEAYRDALRPEDLPGQVREALQRMRQDYQQLLAPELREQAGETVAQALQETVRILEEHGLSPEELAAEAGLDPQEAARRTRERAAHRLERLDEPARSLAEWMIEDYYRVLLGHRDALAYVGVEALRELLRRTKRLEERVLAALDLRDWRKAWATLLPVVRPLPGPLTPENLLEALRAPYRLVEFTGKAHRALCEEVVRSLKGLAPNQNRAWVLWGPGGAGKTRMAVEIGRALEAEGWRAGFVLSFPLAVWAPHLPFWSRPDRPTLLIVDYAEQRPAEELRALARAVREAAPERGAPLALLLLMGADPREAVAGHVADALAEARIRWEARRVPPVEDPEDRQALFRKARARFREALAPPDASPEVDYEPEVLPLTPLALLALAVLAAHGHRVVQSQDEAAILIDLWEQWEQPRWKRTLEAHGGRELLQIPEVWNEARERIEQALVAASLDRPFTAPEEVAAWWEAHFPFRKRTARGERLDPFWLAERLKVLFPGVGEAWRLPPISPDPLADVVLARFGADLGRLVESILPAPEEIEKASLAIRRLVEGWEHGEALSPEQLGGLMIWIWPVHIVREVLPRLSAAAVPGASEAAQAALEAATRWLEKTVEVLPQEVATAWLGTWDRALPPPDRTLVLRPFLADFYRIRLAQTPREEHEERARVLNNLGFALSALGRRAEALEATQEAVDLYRRLAEQHPDAFLPDLAASLHNLGNVLSEMGRRAEALEATQEAVEIRRRLAAQHPDAFLPYLAMSLNNLGKVLSEMGRREEALEATQEAVDLYRRLAEQHPDAFLPYLAGSLNNLGNVLSEMGRREEALEATQEAVDLYRRLAEQHPDAFLPYLARSLGAYGLVLRGLGRSAEAAAAFAEGLRAILPFVRALPAAFGGLAGALLRDYLRACAEAGEAPDEALVEQARRALG
jgi:tetratricopeptide (TPR) repeat protein